MKALKNQNEQLLVQAQQDISSDSLKLQKELEELVEQNRDLQDQNESLLTQRKALQKNKEALQKSLHEALKHNEQMAQDHQAKM